MKATGYFRSICSIAWPLLLFSCEQDPVPNNLPGGFVQVSSIDHIWDGKLRGTEIFNYGSDSLLYRVEDSRSQKYKEFSYDNLNRLEEVRTYHADDNLLVAKDSMIYDQNERVEGIYNFYLGVDSVVKASRVTKFSYDQTGYIKETITSNILETEYKSITRYHWKDNNIVKTGYMDESGELLFETVFRYDSKTSYQLNNPHYISTPWTWTQNNIIFSFTEVLSKSIVVEFVCNPCNDGYRYNSSELPIKIAHDRGETLIINY